MINRILQKIESSILYARAYSARSLGIPIRFTFRGRNYYVNADKSATYHINNSIQKLANMTDLIPCDVNTVFDVGGNCGLFSAFVAISCPNASVYCFEPSPNLIPIIGKNTADLKITVCELAVSDYNGHLNLYINRDAEQTNSINKSMVEPFTNHEHIETRKVRCITLDSFALENQISKIDVLKVDVQGAEGNVFKGARNLLPTVEMLFVESTWMDIKSIMEMIPFALEYGFTHLSVINPVYLGADILLSRYEIKAPVIQFAFQLDEKLLKRNWFR